MPLAKILLVDDEDEIMARFLRDAGYAVDAARNSDEALSFLSRNGTYDLILTDVEHPGINGHVLADLITKADCHQRVGFITTYEVERYPRLLKPICREYLLGFVNRLLTSSCCTAQECLGPE